MPGCHTQQEQDCHSGRNRAAGAPGPGSCGAAGAAACRPAVRLLPHALPAALAPKRHAPAHSTPRSAAGPPARRWPPRPAPLHWWPRHPCVAANKLLSAAPSARCSGSQPAHRLCASFPVQRHGDRGFSVLWSAWTQKATQLPLPCALKPAACSGRMKHPSVGRKRCLVDSAWQDAHKFYFIFQGRSCSQKTAQGRNASRMHIKHCMAFYRTVTVPGTVAASTHT